MSIDNTFFKESKEQSYIKSNIVSKYFEAWAQVIIGTQNRRAKFGHFENRIAYIDLFAGPGRYEDGTKSTPVLVLEKAIKNEEMRNRLVTIFNDKNPSNTDSLQSTIDQIPGIDTLKFKPQVNTEEVGEEIVQMFEKMVLVPTFFFVDPWGYKGLSLRLVNSVIKDWGCDCVFFFNYNRINMGLTNSVVTEHMNALFGKDRGDILRQKLIPMHPSKRELMVVEELCQALRELGASYVLPFRFRNRRGTRVSHHLIFVSKNFKGYEIMKDIMANESSSSIQGVPSFEYNPVDKRDAKRQQLLFELSRPLDDLADMLLGTFAGKTLTMREIYEKHSIDRQYIPKNYKDVLKKLEQDGKISTTKHRKGSFGDKVLVTFPP